jgi:hypothetical protein
MTSSRFFLFGLLTLSLIFSGRATAQGNLLLMPRRVIFEGTKRYEELNLANIGKDTARYVISLMHIRMKEDGRFEEISQPDSGENFADKFLRFFPHSVVLGPSESQVVKIQLTKINELTPGEYRSHLYFRAVPDKAPLGESHPATDSAISIRLIPVFGISIPVIIRSGETNCQVTLSDLAVKMADDTLPMLNMTFNRKGNISAYGDISVDYLSIYGNTVHVGTVKGIAIYTPNTTRRFQFALENRTGVNYRSGKLHVVFSTPAEARSAKIAETVVILH